MNRLVLASCLLALAGCQTHMHPGQVRTSGSEDPIVSVEAGNVEVRGGRFFARYVVDRATRTCWMLLAADVAPLDCCAARRVPALSEVITWETDEVCSGR